VLNRRQIDARVRASSSIANRIAIEVDSVPKDQRTMVDALAWRVAAVAYAVAFKDATATAARGRRPNQDRDAEIGRVAALLREHLPELWDGHNDAKLRRELSRFLWDTPTGHVKLGPDALRHVLAKVPKRENAPRRAVAGKAVKARTVGKGAKTRNK
jgi:hypothetical protein